MKLNIRDIFKSSEEYLNSQVNVEGWIRTSRSSKTFGFIELNDGTFFNNLQIVYDNELSNFNQIEKLPISSAISIKGILVPTPLAKQPFEIKATEILVEGLSTQDYPLQKKRHAMVLRYSIVCLFFCNG